MWINGIPPELQIIGKIEKEKQELKETINNQRKFLIRNRNANIQEKAASSAYRTQKTLTTTVRIPEMPAAITKNNLPGSILKTTSIETVNPAQEEIKEEYS